MHFLCVWNFFLCFNKFSFLCRNHYHITRNQFLFTSSYSFALTLNLFILFYLCLFLSRHICATHFNHYTVKISHSTCCVSVLSISCLPFMPCCVCVYVWEALLHKNKHICMFTLSLSISLICLWSLLFPRFSVICCCYVHVDMFMLKKGWEDIYVCFM